ncbi:SPFH domain-containing protein [Glycomyces xiaoerkulensis]|uniref:SPFH domain-containing protein n=1 Tax=Glycomyces xiaoerkulensis TaxID=2038139 RepID=UPI0012FFE14F|nr:SPFH domain-containing protein [Glycomyces xiaoerkulensis]
MESIVVFAVVLAIVLVVLFARSVTIVPNQRNFVIERLGRYRRTLEPGVGFIAPFIDRVGTRVDLREQVSTLTEEVATADGRTVAVELVAHFFIDRPSDAVYGIEDFATGLERQAVAALRYVVGSMDLKEAVAGRAAIGDRIAAELERPVDQWGLKVTRVEVPSVESR